MTNTENSIHRFESAGLGKAPFRYVGFRELRGPIKELDKDGNWTGFEIGSPGQPMGTCAYCGQGIAICCEIVSADGRSFIVGSDCVEKTGDAGLRKVKTDVQKFAREKQKAREAVRIAAALDRLENDAELRAALAAQPHPNEWRREQGDTLLDAYEWRAKQSGHSGKLKIARELEKK